MGASFNGTEVTHSQAEVVGHFDLNQLVPDDDIFYLMGPILIQTDWTSSKSQNKEINKREMTTGSTNEAKQPDPESKGQNHGKTPKPMPQPEAVACKPKRKSAQDELSRGRSETGGLQSLVEPKDFRGSQKDELENKETIKREIEEEEDGSLSKKAAAATTTSQQPADQELALKPAQEQKSAPEEHPKRCNLNKGGKAPSQNRGVPWYAVVAMLVAVVAIGVYTNCL